MTEPSTMAAIRSATDAILALPHGVAILEVPASIAHGISDDFDAACNPAAMREVLDLLDSQAAEIKRLHGLITEFELQHVKEISALKVRANWIAVNGSFGVDSVSGKVGGNGQRRVSATAKNIDEAMKEAK